MESSAKKPHKEVTEEIKRRVSKLRKAIEHHRYLYHVENREVISAEALDSLKNELVKLEEEYPELITADSPTQRVAGEPLKGFKKVTHKVTQWSFNDAFSEEDIRAFDARTKRFLKAELGKDIVPEYICELKIDGLKVVFEYQNGKLRVAATRGNGIVGEDVTANMRTLESVPLKLRQDANVIVEGEVYMSKSQFARVNKEQEKKGLPLYANPRNFAAGTVRQLDPRMVAERKLQTFIYDLSQTDGKLPETQEAELKLLQKFGFRVNSHFKLCKNIDEVIKFWKKWQEKKESEDYFFDGVVVKVNERKYQDALGYTGKAPRFGIAFKFSAEQVTTTILDITLQVGRTGVLTPVAHLKPVLVAGSTVSRATLHNEDEITRLDVRIGDTVILQKAGDVIPDIVKVMTELRTGKEKKFNFPKRVAECGGAGDIERIPGEAAWRCKDRNGAKQQLRKLYYFAGKAALDIDKLGPKIIDALVEASLVSSYDDIFTITKGDLLTLERFAEKSADNLIASIENAKKVSLPRFLTALSINHVGEETAHDIAEHFGSLENIEKATFKDLVAIEGVGPIVSQSIFEWFRESENKKLVQRLLKQVSIEKEIKKARTKLYGKSFVLTGTLSTMDRDVAKEKIRELGGDVSSSVSANTSYVVVGENPGSKYEKAKELGVKILSEEDFLLLVR